MSVDIVHRYTNALLYRAADTTTFRQAVAAAVASGADLSYADLSYADLSYANLSANLSNANLMDANLSNANLIGANLIGADLSYANLIDANLIGANLIGANLSYADLSGANLSYADLSKANLSYADLSKANLSYADLSGANLSYADLSGANLSYAKMPGFAGKVPTSLKEAAIETRDWLAEKRWIQHCWIKTPNGAYAGQCTACLHGAAIYRGGPEFGPKLSNRLCELGFTVAWNDAKERTESEVLAALEKVAAEQTA